MNKPTRINILLGALLLLALGGWYWSSMSRPIPPVLSVNNTPSETTTSPATTTTTQGSSSAPMTATVNYTANGFSPDPVTIRQGGTVTFVSKDGSPMWVASNAHPTHMQYDGTSRTEHCPNTAGTAFDQCSSGTSFSFVFKKVGSWNYHNHVNADDGGTIMVVQ